jgi:hypothetical protein
LTQPSAQSGVGNLFYAVDAEAEDEHDEPSLGSLDRQPQTRSYQTSGHAWDADLEGDWDGQEADLEPSLGSLSAGDAGGEGSQIGWARGDARDLENEITDEPHDGGDDEEPTLGAREVASQLLGWKSTGWRGRADPWRGGRGTTFAAQNAGEARPTQMRGCPNFAHAL